MNSSLTESSSAMRRMDSASSSATLSWRMRRQALASGLSGIVSVTTSSSSWDLLIRSTALPDNTGCVQYASTFFRSEAPAGPGLGLERDRIGHHQLIELGFTDPLHRASGQHRVRAIRQYLLRPVFLERSGRLAQRTGGVHEVIHQYAGTALDLADDMHHLGLVRLRTPLVDDGEVRLQMLGHHPRPHHA